jgi:hypothetical protein
MEVPGNNQYLRINANTAGMQVKPGQGTVHTVSINVKGTSSNVLTLYDGTITSGTVIANIDTTSNVGSVTLDASFVNGLFAVLATGTAADLTITFH